MNITMNTFLENNVPSTFIHLKEYLNEITAKPLQFLVQEESVSIDAIIKGEFERVKFENEILENNFRMIETYFPEILYKLFTAFDTLSLKEAISIASKQFQYSYNTILVDTYLTLKLFQLFEAIFFGNLLEGVWQGKWQQKVYATKVNSELKYYTMLEGRKLFDYLLSAITISTSEGYNNLEVRFHYKR